MKTNGGLEQQLTTVLKSILKQVQQSQEDCRREGPKVYMHHRQEAKNIQLNLMEVEPLIGDSKTLRALYKQAVKQLSKLNDFRKSSKSPNPKNRSKEKLTSPVDKKEKVSQHLQYDDCLSQLKAALKKNLMLLMELERLKDTIDELTQEKSALVTKVHSLETDAALTARNLQSLTDQLSEQQLIHTKKRQLIIEEIEELRNRLSDSINRNESLVQQNNQLQVERHQLMQLQMEYKHKFDGLLMRVDSEILQLQQRVLQEQIEVSRSQQKCQQLQHSITQAHDKLERQSSEVEVLRSCNQDLQNMLEQTCQQVRVSTDKENQRLRSLNDLRLELALFKHNIQ